MPTETRRAYLTHATATQPSLQVEDLADRIRVLDRRSGAVYHSTRKPHADFLNTVARLQASGYTVTHYRAIVPN